MEHDVIKLHKEIECAKDKLNKSIENGEDYNTIYKNSIAVDKLIAKYLKAEKYVEDNDEWTSVVYKKNIDLTKILPRTGM